MLRNFFAFTIYLLLTAVLFGQEESGQYKPSMQDQFSLGLGAAYSSKVYKGDDSSFYPIPMIYYQKDNLYFKGKTAGYELYKQGDLSLDLIAQWRFDGYDDSDSDYLDGMHDRKMTIDAGAQLAYFDGWGKTTVSFVNDILSKHNGHQIDLSYQKRIKLDDNLSITPLAGLIYQSNNLADYYYGVRRDEAIAGRAKYTAGDSYNPYIGINVNHKLGENWSVIANAQLQWFDDEIKDSPIVDKDHQLFIMAGAAYNF
jgi:outer membrane protein